MPRTQSKVGGGVRYRLNWNGAEHSRYEKLQSISFYSKQFQENHVAVFQETHKLRNSPSSQKLNSASASELEWQKQASLLPSRIQGAFDSTVSSHEKQNEAEICVSNGRDSLGKLMQMQAETTS